MLDDNDKAEKSFAHSKIDKIAVSKNLHSNIESQFIILELIICVV